MDLPEIFKVKIDENLNNNSKSYIGRNKKDDDSIEDVLKDLPVTVYILLKDNEVTTTIIDRTKNYLITRKRDVIYINDILKIKKL